MEFIKDGKNEKNIRRFRSSLSISGISVIALGLWSVFKSVLNGALSPVSLEGLTEADIDPVLAKVIVWTVLFFFLAAELGLRLFVGLSAISESHGKHRKPVYIVMAMIIALFTAISVIPSVFLIIIGKKYFFTSIATVLIDLTSLGVLTELVISAFRLRYCLKHRTAETAEIAETAEAAGASEASEVLTEER
ncbi:MAG: hypothetical protein J5950_09190 [Clostridia bacterium]|nr:hypothetical protein [Clostridia bacterium]